MLQNTGQHHQMPQTRQLVTSFPLWHPVFNPMSGDVGFVVAEVALEQVLSTYFSLPCQFSFQLLYIHYNHTIK
jgi:hypothetical protein